MRIILLIALLLPVTLVGQTQTFLNAFDSSGHRVGYWKLSSSINYRDHIKKYNGVEGFEYGYYRDNQKIGLWIVEDKLGNLIGHQMYIDDTTRIEIQYKKGKIFSIVTYISESTPMTDVKPYREALAEQVISFDNRGRIKGKLIWRKPGTNVQSVWINTAAISNIRW